MIFCGRSGSCPGRCGKLVKDRIETADACLFVDASVQDKRYSGLSSWPGLSTVERPLGDQRDWGVAWWQTGGKEHLYPIDYRVYAPDLYGQIKNDHFQVMFVNAVDQKQIQVRTILFDGWYASAENLKLIHRRKRTFFTTLKSNRLVSLRRSKAIRIWKRWSGQRTA